MQTERYNLLQDNPLIFLHRDTDTAHQQIPVPIYYIHDGDTPFCANASCFCQRGKRAGAMMFQELAEGALLLAQVGAGTQTTSTGQPTVHRVYVPHIEGIPEGCQLLGHTWELTESPDIKECALCHMRGFCPGCTPIPPAGAQPFSCTDHTGRQGQP